MIEETYQITWVILKAAENINAGKYKLAEFLKGSKSKDVAHLSNEQGYGGLLWLNIEIIVAFIEQLEEMGFIKRTSIEDYYSVLELSEAGRKVLDEKIRIELQIAYERKLAFSTIFEHMRRLVANCHISSSEFVEEDKINKILEARGKLKKHFMLREIKEILPDDTTYYKIKCVIADKSLKIKNYT